jgi:hypothetical protein
MANRKHCKRRRIILIILAVLLCAAGVSVAIDLHRAGQYVKVPAEPEEKIENGIETVLIDLENGMEDIDWSRMDGTLQYIDTRYDCADFRLQPLIRILYDYNELIPADTMEKIKSTVLHFKYWLDEPGDDSMCFWSENHQILFATSEYLIGQLYPDEVFTNSGLTGAEHMDKARKRIFDWLEMRWDYGFTEFYSNVYYNEDIAPMTNLIDYARDDEIAVKASIVMDLLIYDYASQSYRGDFNTVSGRAYEGHRKGGDRSSARDITEYLFYGDGTPVGGGGLDYCFMIRHNYTVPQVFIDIAHDTSDVVIKASNGLDVSELKQEGFTGTGTRSVMMQWGMESFTNPEIIRNSLAIIRENDMFANRDLNAFKDLDITLLRILRLEPLVSRIIDPQTNGVAIQRGNTYTYKTADYSMYTAQHYHPGDYGDQQHVQGANVDEHFAIFHLHPAVNPDERGPNGSSPLYWVGYGHLPDAVQDKNVQLAIYDIPEKKGLMEKKLLDYTHAYFPGEYFDDVVIEGRYAFGEKDGTYAVFITTNDLAYREGTTDDLIQPGKQVYWITELGTEAEYGSFENFMDAIKANPVSFDPEKLVLTYTSQGRTYELKFNDYFKVDGAVVDTECARYDSPYIQAAQKAGTLTFTYNGKSLYLDFDHMVREITD